MPPEKGLFIVLEGMDNSGKTTQARLLEQYLEEQGWPALCVREPGSTDIGEEIRAILVKNRERLLDPVTQVILFYAARNPFLKGVVKPALALGTSVIADRHILSSFVYQSWAQGVDQDILVALSRIVTEGGEIAPDIQIVFDVPVEVSMARRFHSNNYGQDLIYEKQNLDFYNRVREGYQFYAGSWGLPILDGTQDVQVVHRQVVDLVEEKLALKRQHA